MKLAGQVALVTGASSGIGHATAWALAEQGADVALNYWTLPEEAQKLAKKIEKLGRRCLLFKVDVAQQDAVEEMVACIAKELGHLDIFVSSAVYSDREPFLTANMEGFRRTIDVTMWGASMVAGLGRQMMKQGRGGNAVLVSSGQARIAHRAAWLTTWPKLPSIRWPGRQRWNLPHWYPREHHLPRMDGHSGRTEVLFGCRNSESRRRIAARAAGSTERNRPRHRVPGRPRLRLHHWQHPHDRRRDLAALVVETRDGGLLKAKGRNHGFASVRDSSGRYGRLGGRFSWHLGMD